MPAGRVLVVLVVALGVAALLNSEAIVRAGEGMEDGPTRDVVLSVGRPLDDVAGAVGLHLPREGLDLAFGQEPKTAVGHRARARLHRDPAPRAARREASFRQPTPARPLRVLVTGRLAGRVRGPAAAWTWRRDGLLRDGRGGPQQHRPHAAGVLQLGGERHARRSPTASRTRW